MAIVETLGVTFNDTLTWVRRTTGNDGSNITDNSNHAYSGSLGFGAGADSADRLWHDQRIVTAGADDDLDLTGLAQQIFTGSLPVAMVNVKAIQIICLSKTTGDKIKLDAGVANAYTSPFDGTTPRLVIGPDSPYIQANKKDGFGAVASSNKMLRINNPGAADIAYKIVVVGTSA